MNLYLGAGLFATFLWWFSTGVIFYLNARPQRTFRWSMLAGTVVMLGALYGVWATADLDTALGAYVAFSCGLIIWGWHTMSYYMGIITGPRREPCPAGCRGWRHFIHAAETGLYHEIAIIATAALLAAITFGSSNQYGLWTFVALWAMHVSAKINVFLGVRNLNKDFIPAHLSYLTRFFRRRAMNLLFPVSVTLGTVVTLVLAQTAVAADTGLFVATGHTLLATLMALAVIEHWFMILPIPSDALWRWSLDPAPVSRNDAESLPKQAEVSIADEAGVAESGRSGEPTSRLAIHGKPRNALDSRADRTPPPRCDAAPVSRR